METDPRIVGRRETRVSPWLTVVEKDVVFPWLPGTQTYYAVHTLPYVAAYAVTPDGKVPLIRQYRPAVEKFTWELPAGLVDDDASPETTCRRELLEETGLSAQAVVLLGVFDIDTGRAERTQHLFLAHCSGPRADFQPELGAEVVFVPEDDLTSWISSGRISSLPHIGAIHIARSYRHRRSTKPAGRGLEQV